MDKLAKSRPSRRAERRSVVWIWKWQLVFPLVEGIRGVFHMKSDRNSRSQVPDPDSFLILTTNWPNMGWSGCESQIVDFGKLQYYCRTQSPPSLSPSPSHDFNTGKVSDKHFYRTSLNHPHPHHTGYMYSPVSPAFLSRFIHHRDIRRCPTVRSPSRLLGAHQSNQMDAQVESIGPQTQRVA